VRTLDTFTNTRAQPVDLTIELASDLPGYALAEGQPGRAAFVRSGASSLSLVWGGSDQLAGPILFATIAPQSTCGFASRTG